jgi:hypothetical protein
MKSTDTESTDNRPGVLENQPKIVYLTSIALCRDGMMQKLLTGEIRLI